MTYKKMALFFMNNSTADRLPNTIFIMIKKKAPVLKYKTITFQGNFPKKTFKQQQFIFNFNIRYSLKWKLFMSENFHEH